MIAPFFPFDKYLHGAVRKLQELDYLADRPGGINVFRLGILGFGVLLGGEKNALVAVHGRFQGQDRFFPPDEERHHHMRENNDVP